MLEICKLGYTIGDDFNLRRKGGEVNKKAQGQPKSSDIHI